MKYVVDTAIAFKWVVIEPLTDKARQLRDDYRGGVHELLSPDLFPTEIANALIVAERRKRILPGQGVTFLRDVNTLPRIVPALPDCFLERMRFRHKPLQVSTIASMSRWLSLSHAN